MVSRGVFCWNRLTYDKAHTTMLNIDAFLLNLKDHDYRTHKAFYMTAIILA